MGGSSWVPDDWKDHSVRTAAKPTERIFTSSDLPDALDPKQFKIRESRDSAAHPNSTPVIVAIDQTGSMGVLAETLIRKGIGILMESLLERKPISDPQLMLMAIGDASTGREVAPIQMTQFESDLKIAEQTETIYLEGKGGGNGYESYDLALYGAAYRTAHDAFEKRGRKGYLFIVGDEPPSPGLIASEVKRYFGDVCEDMSLADLLEIAEKRWHCFHVIVAEGSHPQRHGLNSVLKPWTDVYGERAIVLRNVEHLAETIVSVIQVNEGANVGDVAGSWSGDTSLVVRDAIVGLTAKGKRTPGTGVAKL